MSLQRTLVLSSAVLLSACGADTPTDHSADVLAAEAASEAQRAACRPAPFSGTTSGEITADDCLFETSNGVQHEDLFLVSQSRLGRDDLSGATMLTFTGSADFNAIYGVGEMSGSIFPEPVYGFARFGAGAVGAFGNSFSLIGSQNVYKMWFGGQNADQLGSYTITTSVEPSIDTCENGHWVFLQGTGGFSSDISNETSCRGTVQFGPNVGMPLNYQFWYMKVVAGETLSATLTGVSDPTVALAAFGPGPGQLDLGNGAGDTERSISFTAASTGWVYLEVSSAPDVTSAYTLSFRGS